MLSWDNYHSIIILLYILYTDNKKIILLSKQKDVVVTLSEVDIVNNRKKLQLIHLSGIA